MMKVSHVIAGTLAGMFCITQMISAQEISRQGRYYVEKTEQSYSVKPGGTLFIDTETGSIRVESWNKDEVGVMVEKRADESREDYAKEVFEEIEVEMEHVGDDVRIRARLYRGRRYRSMPLRFTVNVPAKYNLDIDTEGGSIEIGDLEGEVRANTSGGSIEIGQITVGKIDVNTSGGSIEIREGGSDINANTSGGSIEIRKAGGMVDVRTAGGSIEIGPAGGAIRAKTAGGSIRLEESGGRVNATTAGGSISVDGSNGPVDVKTAGGSIRIDNARGAIEAETAGGSIEAELVVSDNNIDTSCDLRTAGGDVTIYVPENLAATIDAEIRIQDNGRGWRSRDYQINSDFDIDINDGNDEDRDRDRDNDRDRRWRDSWRVTGQGDINGGGDRIRLTTTNGDINIRKLR